MSRSYKHTPYLVIQKTVFIKNMQIVVLDERSLILIISLMLIRKTGIVGTFVIITGLKQRTLMNITKKKFLNG